MRLTKSDWNEQHARIRAKQRYNLSLTHREYERISKAIRNPKRKYKNIVPKFLGRVSKWKSVYEVLYGHRRVFCLYSVKQHNIETFFPKDAQFTRMKMWMITNGRL